MNKKRLHPEYYNPRGILLYSAPGVPRFAPIVADLMMRMATDDQKTQVAIYDPFCGNGTILCAAMINYSSCVSNLFGADYDWGAVQSTGMNLTLLSNATLLGRRVASIVEDRPDDIRFAKKGRVLIEHIKRKPSLEYEVRRGNALTATYPSQKERRVIVTDPPYGKACCWKDLDGDSTPESQLDKFLLNILEQGIEKVVLAFDQNQNLGKFLATRFAIKSTARKKKRIIYQAYAR